MKPISDKDVTTYKVQDGCICDETKSGIAYNGIVCPEHKDLAARKQFQAGHLSGLRHAADMLSVKAQKMNDPTLWGLASDIIGEIKAYSERIKENETR